MWNTAWQHKWHTTRGLAVKLLAAVYLGGIYGLILLSLAQGYVLVSGQ
ncbi:MAG: hypothetical protein H7831_00305 [Magnetococcus sp. WYHC-3]